MKVVERKAKDISWSFTGEPQLKLAGWASEIIDPTPCYAHNIELVKKCAKEVTELTFSIPKTTIYVSHFEGTSRTNGWATTSIDYDYYDEEKEEYPKRLHTIFLHGKRTPIHPSITSYIVPHEYGHIVQNWLEREWGLEESDILEPYRKARGLKKAENYGPGTWHFSPGELFANDFRVTLAKAEIEYWPHPGIERTPPKLVDWWKKVLLDPTDRERWAELCDLS